LEIFQGHSHDAYAICNYLSEQYSKGKLENIVESVKSALENIVCGLDISPEACSSFRYEEDDINTSLEEFNFEVIEEPNIIFRPIEVDSESLVIEASLSVGIIVEGGFSFYVIDFTDKDDVWLGSTSVTKNINLDADVLVTLRGDLDKVDVGLEVDDVEVNLARTGMVIDFGEIEPDWMQEDEDCD
jgi:arsenate reductase-like glutaredoxin family protein